MTFGPPPSPFTQSRQAAAEERGKRRRTVVGVLLALSLVAVGAGWYLWPSSSDGSADLQAKSAARPAPDGIRETVERAPKGGLGHLETSFMLRGLQPGRKMVNPGMWATDKVLAKGRRTTLLAVKVKDSSDAWEKPLGGKICAVGKDVTNDGRTVVAFQDPNGAHLCNQLIMFEVETGKTVWQREIKVEAPPTLEPTTIAMTRGVVVMNWWKGSAAVDMASGKTLWTRGHTNHCHDGGFVGGKALLMRYDCYEPKTQQNQFRIMKMDPRTGKALWTYKVARGVSFSFILSSEPPVLAVAAGDLDVTNLISLDGRGKYRADVRMEGGHYKVECDTELVGTCSGVIVGKDQLFVTSGEDDGEIENVTNWVVAFDLKTGHSGFKFDAGDNQELRPIRMSGDDVIAVKRGTDSFTPDSVVRLDSSSGKQKTYFTFTTAGDTVGEDGIDILFQDGRLFVGNQALKGSGKAELPDAKWLAYGVGRVN
jgi:outer membrane protein assembly factor BamB